MSRCLPYPPPGYVRNGVRDEALIESIKLQREEKAKKERKKEGKRQRKEKENAWESGGLKSKKHGHKKSHRGEKSHEDQKRGGCKKRRHNEVEYFERSSLTEEHGHPVGSQNSTDSTLDSSNRHKQSLVPNARHDSGSIMRIRLPLQRQKDPEMLPSKDQPCSALGRTDDASVKRMHEPDPVPGKKLGDYSCSTSSQKLNLRHNDDESSLSFEASGSFVHQAKSDVPSNICGSCSPRLAKKLRDLVENWVTPQVQHPDVDNQDWLFDAKPKQNQNSGITGCNGGNDGLSHGNSTPWPRVYYLPEVDVYALPFTVPF